MTDPQKFHVSIEADVTISPILPPQPPILPYGLHLLPQGVTPTVLTLDDSAAWLAEYDEGTKPGTATGTMAYPVTVGGRQARQFKVNHVNGGGYRAHILYANDTHWTHEVYGVDVYIANPDQLACLELDNNKVMSDGRTVITGVQAATYSKKWQITKQTPTCAWVDTLLVTDPRTWPANTWIHIERYCQMDAAGNVTYNSVYFNGVTSLIGVTLPSAQALGWKIGDSLINFQVNGFGTGEVTVSCANVVVARW